MLPEIAAAILLIIGTLTCLVATYGLLRLDSIHNRIQAAGMVVTLGAAGVLLSLVLAGPAQAGWKAVATAVFLLLTGPLVSRVLARAAHRQGDRSADSARKTGRGRRDAGMG